MHKRSNQSPEKVCNSSFFKGSCSNLRRSSSNLYTADKMLQSLVCNFSSFPPYIPKAEVTKFLKCFQWIEFILFSGMLKILLGKNEWNWIEIDLESLYFMYEYLENISKIWKWTKKTLKLAKKHNNFWVSINLTFKNFHKNVGNDLINPVSHGTSPNFCRIFAHFPTFFALKFREHIIKEGSNLSHGRLNL